MPDITLPDISLQSCQITPRVAHLRDAYFRAIPEVCTERPLLITQYHKDHGLLHQNKISVLQKAMAYRHALMNRTPVIWHQEAYEKGCQSFSVNDRSYFAGSTTSHFKGVPLYPEYLALTLWPELHTIGERAANPYYLSESDAEELNASIFPYWMEDTLMELARKHYYPEDWAAKDPNPYPSPIKLMEYLVFFMPTKVNCVSHTIPSFTRAVNEGLRAVMNDAHARGEAAQDPAQKEFYQAIEVALDGIILYARNLAAKAQEMAQAEPDAERRRELLDMARIYAHVPEYPARSFREALTTIWICWIAVHLENANVGVSLGRLDQLLHPLYKSDINAGSLTAEQAVELLCCLWLKIGDHVPTVAQAGEQLFGGTGSNQAITIGGIDTEGNDAVNDLTYVMLRATELMKLRDPNLNARYYSGVNEPRYLRRLCEVNVSTGATPALHNDKAVITALMSKGDTLEQARDYGVIGCVEPSSAGRTYAHSGAILLNLTSALELALFNGKHRHTGMSLQISPPTGEPSQFKSFEDFRNAFETQAKWLIQSATTFNNLMGKIHQRYYPTPVLSALFEGPMEKGKDLIEGGATINASGMTVIGLADVADSLSAIQRVVFEERSVTFAELLDAINTNFEHDEVLYKRLGSPIKTPKYGNDDPAADANAQSIVTFLDTLLSSIENYRGGRYRVGYWSMTNHAGFGRLMQALPNGRKARENFASGITPVSGVTPSLTAALSSVGKLPAVALSSGIALNIKYTPEPDTSAMLSNFAASVEGYFDDMGGSRSGGMEIQFNVTNHDTFIDAVRHPENYPELLVRVSGYTAYFKDLNPQMQKEIIDRTEYWVSKGTALFYEPFELPAAERAVRSPRSPDISVKAPAAESASQPTPATMGEHP